MKPPFPRCILSDDEYYDSFCDAARTVFTVGDSAYKGHNLFRYVEELDGVYIATDPPDDIWRAYESLSDAIIGEDLGRIDPNAIFNRDGARFIAKSAALSGGEIARLLYTPVLKEVCVYVNDDRYVSDGDARYVYDPALPPQFRRAPLPR